MGKNFELGLVLGRYQHIHLGHIQIIEATRKLCNKTLILIGSAEKNGTLRNPFSLEIRQKAIEKIYNYEDVIIKPLNDMTHENDISYDWGKYILNNVKELSGKIPDLMVYGKDESRKGWFSPEDSSQFSELIFARNKINISATKLRDYLVLDKKQEWQKYVPEAIWEMYYEFREELLKLECYKK